MPISQEDKLWLSRCLNELSVAPTEAAVRRVQQEMACRAARLDRGSLEQLQRELRNASRRVAGG